MSEFMKKVVDDFKTKKDLRESTIKNYMRSLKVANCNQEFTSLAFLNKKKQVDKCIDEYKEASRKTVLTAICSVLKMYEKETLHKYYYDKLMSYQTPVTNDKSEAQKENWLEWSEVLKIKDELAKKSDTKENRLKRMVVALYTEIEPRRSLDYIAMHVVPKIKVDLSTDKNYIALKENVFVFNRYKTDKSYGRQIVEIPTKLRSSIDEYLAQHPLKEQKDYPFLINAQNQPFKGSNSITMMLNRIFKRKISSSMLRHIFLTNKFGDDLKERQKVAEKMGHSVSQQADYIKFD